MCRASLGDREHKTAVLDGRKPMNNSGTSIRRSEGAGHRVPVTGCRRHANLQRELSRGSATLSRAAPQAIDENVEGDNFTVVQQRQRAVPLLRGQSGTTGP
jgi:hypothetical protein